MQAFLTYGTGYLHSKRHHGPGRPRAGPAAPGHVHRLDRFARPPPPRLRGGRQRRRRGPRGSQRPDRSDDPPGQLGHRGRPWPRHPGRHGQGAGHARAHRRPHEAARRRQVRRRGLHGLGVSVVNALSERLVAEVHRDGKLYSQEFERGAPKADMKKVGPTNRTGTTITYLPDAEIFEEMELSAETLQQRLRETAFLTRGLRIRLVDERADGETVEFHYEGGIRDFVAHVNAANDPVHKRIVYF